MNMIRNSFLKRMKMEAAKAKNGAHTVEALPRENTKEIKWEL